MHLNSFVDLFALLMADTALHMTQEEKVKRQMEQKKAELERCRKQHQAQLEIEMAAQMKNIDIQAAQLQDPKEGEDLIEFVAEQEPAPPGT